MTGPSLFDQLSAELAKTPPEKVVQRFRNMHGCSLETALLMIENVQRALLMTAQTLGLDEPR